MKTICRIKLLLPLLLFAACNQATEPRFGDEAQIRSIAYLKSLCDGAVAVSVRQDICIRGRITGNDHYGEFYKTLVMEDATGGISIAAESGELAADYPFGREVTVRCNGLALYDYGGKILLGTTPGDQGIGRIPQRDLARYLRAEAPDKIMPLPATLAFGQIGLQHVDTYVRFDGVSFPDGGNWCTRDPETHRSVVTEHRIVDAADGEFTVRTAGTCLYADDPVPSGTGSLCGVIDYFNGKFTLRITRYQVEFTHAATPPRACP